MSVVGSNRYYLIPKEKRTLALMAKNGSVIEDIEEGEISDETQSVEEISAEVFKHDAKVSKPKGDSRVWMGDLLKYRVSSNYGPGLYNLAWAQAVQNKPLDEILMRDCRSKENSKRSSSNSLVNSRDEDNNNNKSLSTAKEVCNIIIDDSSEEVDSKVQDAGQDEKEEGELEEGEIEVDSETVGEPMEGVCGDNLPLNDPKRKDDDFEKKIQSVREVLQSVTVKEDEKSFYGVCSQLCECLDDIEKLVFDNCGSNPAADALSPHALAKIRAVNDVFLSMNAKQQEKNKEALLRLLLHSKSKIPALFLPEQLQEIEAAIDFPDAKLTLSSGKGLEKKEAQNNNRTTLNEFGISGGKPGQVFDSSNKFISEPASVKLVDHNYANTGSETLKQGLFTGFRNRGAFGPLLDLHSDHDADSLPSPTRESPPTFSLPKSHVIGVNIVKSGSATPKATSNIEDGIVHPYVTDALKAVSNYQQKFGRTSFLMNTRLPSPTPSEECDIDDGDCNGEVSSSSAAGSSSSVNLAAPLQPFGSTSQVNSASLQAVPKIVEQLGSGLNPSFKAQAKSRDPRLRFANLESGVFDLNQHPPAAGAPKTESFGVQTNSRKNKIVDESVLDGHALKRQRNGLTSLMVSRDVQMVSGNGGWIEDNNNARSVASSKRQLEDNLGTECRQPENGQNVSGQRNDAAGANINVRNGCSEQLKSIGSNTTVSLPSLLKDIAVNPTMLMQLIVEQQKLAEAQKSSNLVQNASAFGSSVIAKTVPVGNASSSSSSDNGQMSVTKPQSRTQVFSTVEGGKIRMKPRDPRRVLHGGILQKNESLGPGPEQFKVNGGASSIPQMGKDDMVVRQQGEQAQATSMPSQSGSLPDIARQFTKKLKNLADIVTSQATNTVSTVPLSGSSQLISIKMETSNVGAVTNTKDQQSGSSSKSEEGMDGTSRPQNTWGDFEHLFEGYDDQQKAAIQRERARRIEEQNKMFAARKLCLVLDLDHTLLNSAKFNEVDPKHEEILRKKEEQDREKPYRHLFRLQHMGMWTKLRPGVWNFLEKASKLFELHLYTMGNKLYATEMAKVLDPTGALFSGRVISKGDEGDPCDGDERVPKSKDLDGVLGMESAVVIIDDSVRVWPHNKLNLIVVERYTYFPCSRRQFGLLGPSLLEIDHDERPEDGTLASSLAVIERIHQSFFSHWSLHDVDVRNILASEQRKILAGCRIVFSRVFPVGEANPHLHPLWQTAEQFGAVCTTQIDEQVTHVVANSRGTDKVNWALSTGRFVVQPGWVEASALLYRRANEHDFAV